MNRHKLAGLLAVAVMLPLPSGVALAAYHSDSDTGVSALDYIEDRHRAERENRLSDEQKKLLEDAKALEKNLFFFWGGFWLLPDGRPGKTAKNG